MVRDIADWQVVVGALAVKIVGRERLSIPIMRSFEHAGILNGVVAGSSPLSAPPSGITHAQGFDALTARTINLRLLEALGKQIEVLAKPTARTKSFLAIDALAHYVQSETWQIRDIHEGIQEADAGVFASDKQVKAVFAKYGAWFMSIKWTQSALAKVIVVKHFRNERPSLEQVGLRTAGKKYRSH